MELTPFTPLKLLRHADRVDAMLRGDPVMPISVELDLSNSCPHDCPFCSFGTSESQGYRQQTWVQFPAPRMLRLLGELKDAGVKSVTFTGGGEPLIHRQATAILLEAARLGLAFGVVTNGWLLRGSVQQVIAEHATFVRISLDAGSTETHRFTHGLTQDQYPQILANLRATRELAGDRLTIGAGFCAMDANWKEIYKAAKDVRDHGGNYLEVRPTYPTEWRGDGWGAALSDAQIDLAKIELAHAQTHLNSPTFRVIGMVERFDALNAPTKHYQHCRIGPLMTVIGADGRGWHCCVQRGQPGFSWGSVLNQSFADAWAHPQRQAVIEGIEVARCPRCRYDGFNELIERAFLSDEMHGQFL